MMTDIEALIARLSGPLEASERFTLGHDRDLTCEIEFGDLRDLIAHIRALSRAVEGEQWQPMETVPRDGTPFLAIGTDFGLAGNAQHYAIVRFSEPSGAFFEVGADGMVMSYMDYWKPLKPPAAFRNSVKADDPA